MSKQEIKDALVSVLCDPDGKVRIEGSDEDRDILQRAIESLDDCIVIKKADVQNIEGVDRVIGFISSPEFKREWTLPEYKLAKLVNEAMKEE